ncbi:hypothetical protein BIFBRE_04773 [Bifidobacterium breve DSM 20213 = JCM 1192]|uniref:Uncharacterized protein n=1 Tax=Bifidobacterium breve DSM 20213 = JCM 1192 TaxID=518634 RepID=D4BRN4_BIFBR|nr:hypothetical protein BIFBRE_04773 [Bifidobacterium breve DSM 20213 = JCM 1192]
MHYRLIRESLANILSGTAIVGGTSALTISCRHGQFCKVSSAS